MKTYLQYILLFFPFVLLTCNSTTENYIKKDIFIRVDQVGYLPNDVKGGVILSNEALNGKIVKVKTSSNKEVFSSKLNGSFGKYGEFKFSYQFDFSPIKTKGKYYIECEGVKSYEFSINDNIYNLVVDSLLQFYKVQRCGYTNPIFHNICHKADVEKLIIGKDTIAIKVDVTGGWHDAGDYTKFLNTTAYTTYMLLFAYEQNPNNFEFDYNKNNIPDILEEAKVGLDWLLRAYYTKDLFITQVQGWQDQQVGWRMPENDVLEFNRPGFVGIGKNLIGIYVATMSIASRIWQERIKYPDFASLCLTKAENLYSIYKSVKDVDSSGTGMYIDKNYLGKLALGAVELYITTGRQELLKDAKYFAEKAGSDYWWSWGDINSLAHFRLAKYDSKFVDYIYNNLVAFNNTKNSKLFSEGAAYTWGTTNTLLGISLQSILYKKLTGSNRFDSLNVAQRNYVLGKNPWGVCFISKIGTNYTKNFHHQVGYFKKYLPGALAAGPIAKEFLNNYNIKFDAYDKYKRFQTDDAYYRDDKNDYITNEPTIVSNATAIFVFGNHSNR
jgi:hypothetical protein